MNALIDPIGIAYLVCRQDYHAASKSDPNSGGQFTACIKALEAAYPFETAVAREELERAVAKLREQIAAPKGES